MECIYCRNQNQAGAVRCARCGKPLPRYAAPEGFDFDPERGLYSRPHGERKTLLFDPVSGQYAVEEEPTYAAPEGFTHDPDTDRYIRKNQTGNVVQTVIFNQYSGEYTVSEESVLMAAPPVPVDVAPTAPTRKAPPPVPQELAAISAPKAAPPIPADMIAAPAPKPKAPPPAPAYAPAAPAHVSANAPAAPAPVPAYTPIAPAPASGPVGFTLDPASGLYYRVDDGGLKGGNHIYYMTWYDPATQEYAQVEYTAPGLNAQHTPPANRPTRAAPPHRKAKSRGPLVAILCVVLVAALGVIGWALREGGIFGGDMPNDDRAASSAVSASSRPAASSSRAEPPPADQESVSRSEQEPPEDSASESQDAEESEEPEPPAPEIAAWAAAYADYLQGGDFSYREFEFFGNRTMLLTHEVNGVAVVAANASFHEISSYDYPVMILSEFAEMQGNPGMIDTFQFSVAYLVKDGAATSELTAQETEAIFYENEMGFMMANGDSIARFEISQTNAGPQSEDDVRASLQNVIDWLGEQEA